MLGVSHPQRLPRDVGPRERSRWPRARAPLQCLEEGLLDASAASPAVKARMVTAYMQLQLAVIRFEAYLTLYSRCGATEPSDAAILGEAREGVLACHQELEHVVLPEFGAEAKRLDVWPKV